MRNNKWKYGIASVAAILTMTGCNGGDSTDTGTTYTYNTYLSTSPSNWNVHNWQTSDESYVTGFTEMGFYDAVLNDEKNGYNFVTEMAAEMPIAVSGSDLTDDEIDTYYPDLGNVANNMVWDIELNQDAKWEDGTAITADDYVQSMERLLNPKYANYRADSYYNGNMIVVNAENYYKQGRQTIEPFYKWVSNETTGTVKDDSGFYFLNLGKGCEEGDYISTIYSNADSSTSYYDVLNQLGETYGVKLQAERIINAYSYYLWKALDHSGSSNKNDWEKVTDPSKVSSTMIENDSVDLDIDVFDNGFKDFETGETIKIMTIKDVKEGWTEDNIEEYSTDDLKADLKKCVDKISSRNKYAGKAWSWKLPLRTYVFTYDGEKITSDDIGIKTINSHRIRFYLTKSITPLNLKFSLTSNFLVNVKLYDSLTKELTNGSWATSYASNSVSNYMSYGPYKLTYFETGKEIRIERNENWYGYSDGKHEGQFQMDKIITNIYTSHDTAMQQFLAGKLDDIDLTVNGVRDYGTSSRCTTTYESYTQKLSFNSSREMLLDRQGSSTTTNKTILANDDFRKGLSLSLNRTQFASQATSGSKGFTGLLNDLYLANNATGESYRSTTQGKSVYGKVYGTLGGDTIGQTDADGNPIALSEDATGYNHNLAIAYVVKALKDELASSQDGHIKAGDKISIEFLVYDESAENTKLAYNFINDAWATLLDDASEQLRKDGTLKDSESITLEVTTKQDKDYYTTAQNGRYDMIFSTWGGAAINPYGLMQVYCDNSFTQTCEYGFKGKQAETKLDIDLNGDGIIDPATETRSFAKWYDDMNNGDEFSEAKYGDEVAEDDENYEDWYKVHNQKLTVLAGLEAGILNRFEAVPLVARGSSSLLGFKCEYATKTYVSLIGYGGIRLMTFNYNDAQWSEFCSRYNNDLSSLYKGV